MVGILDVLAVEVGSFLPVVCQEVFFSKFTLSHGRIGLLLKQLFELLDTIVLVDIEICVCILHVTFRIGGVVEDRILVFGSCSAIVFGVHHHIAFEHVDGGVLILGVLTGFVDVLLDVFGVFYGVGVEVSTGDREQPQPDR